MQVELHEAKKLQAGAAKAGVDTIQERKQMEEQRRQLDEQRRQLEEKTKSVDQKARTTEEKERMLQNLDQDLKKRKARMDQLEQQLQKVIALFSIVFFLGYISFNCTYILGIFIIIYNNLYYSWLLIEKPKSNDN